MIHNYNSFISNFVDITTNCISIRNSYKVEKREDMECVITDILYKNPYWCGVNDRSYKSLIDEWCVHNLLYNMHILRSRTGSVDLNGNQKKLFKIGYYILSKFYWK